MKNNTKQKKKYKTHIFCRGKCIWFPTASFWQFNSLDSTFVPLLSKLHLRTKPSACRSPRSSAEDSGSCVWPSVRLPTAHYPVTRDWRQEGRELLVKGVRLAFGSKSLGSLLIPNSCLSISYSSTDQIRYVYLIGFLIIYVFIKAF